jgi:signal transduction histidine kinase
VQRPLDIPATGDRAELAVERGLLRAVAVFRWAAWAWMAIVAAIDLRNGPVAHPGAMVVLVGAALVWTATATVVLRTRPAWLLSTPALAVELAIGATLVVADTPVYGADSAHAQSLGSVWPLAGVLVVGIRFAGRGGLVAGAAIGVAAWVGKLAFEPGRWYGDRTLGSVGTTFLYSLGGVVGGLAAVRLREARREIGEARAREEAARAREEVARTLHDGVLQTLAVVQRRSEDPDLVRMARDQEVELRRFLFDGGDDGDPGLPAVLREVAATAERRHGMRVEVVVVPDAPEPDAATRRALRGAVTELCTNAAKHGDAERVTVFVDAGEPDADGRDTLVCSVKDDGRGFGPDGVEGTGLTRSVRGRMAEVGGSVAIGAPTGRGAEVRLEVPVPGPDDDRRPGTSTPGERRS